MVGKIFTNYHNENKLTVYVYGTDLVRVYCKIVQGFWKSCGYTNNNYVKNEICDIAKYIVHHGPPDTEFMHIDVDRIFKGYYDKRIAPSFNRKLYSKSVHKIGNMVYGERSGITVVLQNDELERLRKNNNF